MFSKGHKMPTSIIQSEYQTDRENTKQSQLPLASYVVQKHIYLNNWENLQKGNIGKQFQKLEKGSRTEGKDQ